MYMYIYIYILGRALEQEDASVHPILALGTVFMGLLDLKALESMNEHVCIHIYIYIYTHIHIQREREREREKQTCIYDNFNA